MTTGIVSQEQEYRKIDTRMKEIYFEAHLVKEDRRTLESRFKFWNTLNIMAINNMSIQQIRMRG